MDTLDARLMGLSLCWLLTRPKHNGSRAKLQEALWPLVEHHFGPGQWKERCRSLIERMLEEELVTAGSRGGLSLRKEGVARGLRFLGVEARPRGLTWQKLNAAFLPAVGLGLPPSPAILTWIGNADGFRAALLQRHLGGEGKPTPTLKQVRDRLLWRQLGVEAHRPFTLPAVQKHLLSAVLELDVTDPKLALQQLAARTAGAARVDADSIRLAQTRRWLMAADKSPPAEPSPQKEASAARPEAVPDFAARVLATARALPESARFGSDRVFIAYVWRVLQRDWRDRDSFDKALLEANRVRELSLSRADLVSAMDRTVVAESEVRAPGDRYHFIALTSPAQESA